MKKKFFSTAHSLKFFIDQIFFFLKALCACSIIFMKNIRPLVICKYFVGSKIKHLVPHVLFLKSKIAYPSGSF